MKILTALLTTVVLATSVNTTAIASKSEKPKSAQCKIGRTFFDCTKVTTIVGQEAHTEIQFGLNESWLVKRTWDDSNSNATLKSSKKRYKVATYWRDEDFYSIVPFGSATEYDWECFQMQGAKQDFCWKQDYS